MSNDSDSLFLTLGTSITALCLGELGTAAAAGTAAAVMLPDKVCELLISMAGDRAGDFLEDRKARREQAESLLTNNKISAFTGQVLAALVTDFANRPPRDSASVRGRAKQHPHAKALKILASALPPWWDALCASDNPATKHLRGQAFIRTVAERLTDPAPRDPVSRADLFSLLRVVAAAYAPSLKGPVLEPLAAWLESQFAPALTHALVKDGPVTTTAYRKTILRFHSETLATLHLLKNLPEELRSVVAELRRDIAGRLERLEDNLREGVRIIRKENAAVKDDTSAIRAIIEEQTAPGRRLRYAGGAC